ncbi:hypothetical protein [Caviibacterium pharyngocola]|uniref:Uncharacterized protein n=1 Tax=Caviibacterium pharyngocola TaxID=28159 RepID=A0A2M8RVA0_9PAST|nr:hypothetical protein [Caviibacterium pharyngocola]PJG82793.1 hypothetical protein CVP04_07470 [Caviibacterium pharyngocola]
MKILTLIKQYLSNINLKVLSIMAEDCRKIATFSIGAGIIGTIIDADNMTYFEAFWAILTGLYFWVLGTVFAYIEDKLRSKGEEK